MNPVMARRPEPDRMAYWQAVDSGRLLLMAAAAMLVTASFASTAVVLEERTPPIINWSAAVAFGGLASWP